LPFELLADKLSDLVFDLEHSVTTCDALRVSAIKELFLGTAETIKEMAAVIAGIDRPVLEQLIRSVHFNTDQVWCPLLGLEHVALCWWNVQDGIVSS